MELDSQPVEYGFGAAGNRSNFIALSALGPGGYGSNDVDTENPDNRPKNISFNDHSIRRGFIRKVYLILMGQLMVTFGAISLVVSSNFANKYIKQNNWIFWVALIIMLITMLSMFCCEKLRRETPTNYIFLALFTVAQSFLLSVSASIYTQNEVLLAVGIAAVVCLALSLFALQTKYDFTAMGGILLCCLVILVIFGIVAIFVDTELITLIYGSLSALLFSIYLIYDTQLMLGGQHKHSISPEEYIFAALNIYLDVVNIFMDILTIIGGTD